MGHVAVGVTRRHCANAWLWLLLPRIVDVVKHATHFPPTPTHRPHHEEPRFALSASPTRPSHAHMCKQHLGRPSDTPADPQPLFLMIRATRNTRTQHVQASTPPTTYLFVICESRPQTDI